MVDQSSRRAPLAKGRRISLNVNLSPEIHRELGKIAGGNRSAAIETLVLRHIADREAKIAVSEPIG
jgi:hypothetical protein